MIEPLKLLGKQAVSKFCSDSEQGVQNEARNSYVAMY